MTNDDILYYVRIKSISFTNFRNIEKSSIEFPNSKINDFYEGKPSIVGLYGQNGSGKTSVIMALGILKSVLSGEKISDKYASAIQYGHDRCTLEFAFSLYTKYRDADGKMIKIDDNDLCADLFYSFDIAKHTELTEDLDFGDTKTTETLKIENEIFKYRVESHEGIIVSPKQTLIDTRSIDPKSGVFGSEDKAIVFCGSSREILTQYTDLLKRSADRGQPFIFSLDTYKLFNEGISKYSDLISSDESVACFTKEVEDIEDADSLRNYRASLEFISPLLAGLQPCALAVKFIQQLKWFGHSYLHVVDTVTTGLTNVNTNMPLLLWVKTPENLVNFKCYLKMNGVTSVAERYYNSVRLGIRSVSDVLEVIIPGLRLNIIDLGFFISEKNEKRHSFEIMAERGNTVIPLKYESDGIRRIISILSLLIAVYNDDSFTIAIDEIDSGIFEYLLGELLSVLSESLKGQLIFTSHNLRPLEVLPSKYLYFTTTDPANRFTKIAARGNSNLRDTYFRNIVLDAHKDHVYAQTKKYDIELAFLKAGNSKDIS